MRTLLSLPTLSLVLPLSIISLACSASDDPVGGPNGGGSGSSSGSGSGSGAGSSGGIDLGVGGGLSDGVGICGDSRRTSDEACDDGNTDPGDGCAADCSYVEPGYICNLPGEACSPFVSCGDGLLAWPEQCDDGNEIAGDGCSPHCKVEIGWQCTEAGCSATTCGNSVIEGTETCDDGNAIPFDGCSAECQLEPDCSSSPCTSSCGDGILLQYGDEECDDGNEIDGDGCSKDCKKEIGYECNPEKEQIAGTEVIKVSAVYRDFSRAHTDFGLGPQDQGFEKDCDNGGDGAADTSALGLVEDALSASGKPVLKAGGPTNACISSAATFNQWYTGAGYGGVAGPVVGEVLLFKRNDGKYVNRFGIDGDGTTPAQYNGLDGNPLFFPLPVGPDGGAQAGIPQTPYGGNWGRSGPARNFYFTSEIVHWFQYDAGTTAVLDFMGDDDVWVFIDGKLVVDLGGLHAPIQKAVIVDFAKAAELGLQDGKVYPIQIFHAERKEVGSSFKLTLSGFETARSLCLPICGDGTIGAGEQCDDGPNNVEGGGYNVCDTDCKLGGFCGDGIKQENEVCDDNDPSPDAPSNCAGCQILTIR